MWKGMKVIDADAHMHEPKYLWERYVEPKYRDQVPKVAFMDGNFMVYEPDGKIIPHGDLQQRPPESAWKAMEEKYGEAYKTWWSPETRLQEMDRYGWDIQVLLPTGNNGNFAYRVALQDLALGAAMCRAYNNWAHEYCSVNAKRLKFVAVLPGSDVGEMVKEARRAVDQLGAVSVRNPVLPAGRWLHEPEYEALWELACELDFPISAHGEYRSYRFQPFRKLEAGRRESLELALRGLDHALGFPCVNMATLGHFCAIACDSDEKTLSSVAEYLKGENIVWNTDYPHPDAIEPAKALPEFDAHSMSEQAKAKILWDNAVKLFGQRIAHSD